MRPTLKTLYQLYLGSRFFVLLVLSCFASSYASTAQADIYRFVTIDGVETFTDTPVNGEAKLLIRDNAQPAPQKPKKSVHENMRGLPLNKMAKGTVQNSLEQMDTQNYFEPQLPQIGGNITSATGMRIDPIDGKWRHHNGIDISIPEGTPVTPVAPGTVIYSGLRPGYGHTVLVEHVNRLVTLYAHNSRTMVADGQQVDAGTVLALSGNSGRSTAPHLHFEAWQSGVNVTQTFMPGSSRKLQGIQFASAKNKSYFRKEILADGSILFTNIPPSTR